MEFISRVSVVEINDAGFVEARTPDPATSPPPSSLGTETIGAATEDAVT